MIVFYTISDRPLFIYISGGSMKKGIIEEGANSPRYRSCMSCLQSLVRSQYRFHTVLHRLLGSGISGGPASSKVTVDMRESKGQIMDS